MGKATGFLEKTRELPKAKAPQERIKIIRNLFLHS